jgi:transposase
MNSDMFVLWVKEKLIPVFEQQYLGKTMVLVADNAPHHHKRVIGSLVSVSKKKIVDMMVEHSVEYIDLPLTGKRMELVGDKVEDRGDCIRIQFDPEEQNKRARARDPRIANGEELKVALVNYLRDNKPEMLECKVEKFLHDKGFKVIWTPPYCPDLQPIKLFWAAGKNHAALYSFLGRTMKETVSHLREGWYGNEWDLPIGHSRRKYPVNCYKLFLTSLEYAATKSVPLCKGISGTIGNLVVDGTYQEDPVAFPIEALVIDLTKED